MARKPIAIGLFTAVTLATLQAASAGDAYTVKARKAAPECGCQPPTVHRTTVRHQLRSNQREDDGLAWAQTIERSIWTYGQQQQPIIVGEPTYNIYIPADHFYGPTPPPPSYYPDQYYGYGARPPVDDGARLDPWHGYNPYRPENGY